eukprot:gene13227-19068_t
MSSSTVAALLKIAGHSPALPTDLVARSALAAAVTWSNNAFVASTAPPQSSASAPSDWPAPHLLGEACPPRTPYYPQCRSTSTLMMCSRTETETKIISTAWTGPWCSYPLRSVSTSAISLATESAPSATSSATNSAPSAISPSQPLALGEVMSVVPAAYAQPKLQRPYRLYFASRRALLRTLPLAKAGKDVQQYREDKAEARRNLMRQIRPMRSLPSSQVSSEQGGAKDQLGGPGVGTESSALSGSVEEGGHRRVRYKDLYTKTNPPHEKKPKVLGPKWAHKAAPANPNGAATPKLTASNDAAYTIALHLHRF